MDEATLSYKSGAPSIETIENPTTGKAEGPADGGAIVTLRGSHLKEVRHVLFGEREASIIRKDDEVLFVRVPEGQEGAVHVILTVGEPTEDKPTNIGDFATAGKAIYKYTPSTKISVPLTPSIDSIENPTNGRAEGPVDADVSVVIRGINLQDIEDVRFGQRKGKILQRGSHVLFVQVPHGEEGGVPVLVETVERPDKTRLNNIDDFKIPGRAIYKYTARVKPGPEGAGETAEKVGASGDGKPTPPISRKPKSKRTRCAPCR
jgi:hypothetical protein